MLEVRIDGLEELVRRIVREEVAAAREEAPEWLGSREAADYLGTSIAHVHNLVSEGRLPRHGEKGHAIRLRRSELDQYVETRGR